MNGNSRTRILARIFHLLLLLGFVLIPLHAADAVEPTPGAPPAPPVSTADRPTGDEDVNTGPPLGAQPGTTFAVNSTADAVDANPGNGICAAAGGACTLRAAIQETNALPGADTITLPSGAYVLTIPGDDENAAATGDLDITDHLTVNGAGAATTTVDGNASVTGDRVFHIRGASPTVTLSGLSLIDGVAELFGGAIRNGGALTLNAIQLSGNQAGSGGGIYNEGTLTVNDGTFSGNSATGTTPAGGGAIYNTGTLTVNNSTISDNVVDTNSDRGGGIYNDLFGVAAVNNSTLSGNTSGHGGAIFNERGTVTVANSTITGNSVRYEGGGIYHHQSGSVTIVDTVLAGNTSDDVLPAGPDCRSPYGPFHSGGYNLLGNNEGCNFSATNGDQVGTPGDPIDPMLGPLQDNGGPTETHALLPGSPAIDTGNPEFCPSEDQRGSPRPVDGDGNGSAICDIGAFEKESPPPGGDFFLRHDPDSLDICAPGDAVYEIRVGSEGGFSDPVDLTASGVPAGATSDFDLNPVIPPGISMFTISNTGSAAAGSYDTDVTGTGSSGSHTTTMTLNLYKRTPGRPLLLTPPNGAMNQPLQPAFTWQAAVQARTYSIEIALDRQFTQIVDEASGLVDTTYTPAIELAPNTRHFWRVRAENACGNGRYSAVFRFQTGS